VALVRKGDFICLAARGRPSHSLSLSLGQGSRESAPGHGGAETGRRPSRAADLRIVGRSGSDPANDRHGTATQTRPEEAYPKPEYFLHTVFKVCTKIGQEYHTTEDRAFSHLPNVKVVDDDPATPSDSVQLIGIPMQEMARPSGLVVA
jgi:hypothetical protein